MYKSVELLNYRARSIQQSGNPASDSASNPYTSAGLKGDGQIVSIADTGVDSSSCYFYDSKGTVTPSVITEPIFDLSYRKIIQYAYIINGGDTSDVADGHGTHICGIVVGNILDADITSSTDNKYF
jgi:subtilisin family serine protease